MSSVEAEARIATTPATKPDVVSTSRMPAGGLRVDAVVLLHMPLIHLIAVIVCYAAYGNVHWMFESPSISQFPFTSPPGWGLPLPAIYLIWVCVVCLLYPLCRVFATAKLRRSAPWLSYV